MLLALGVASDRIYIDHGMSGTKRERPGLDQALAAVRTGDTLVVPKLDRLARSVPEGMAVARAQGKLKGRQPKLSPKQQRELKRMHDTGEHTITDLGELFSVSRPTVYRTINRTAAVIT